MGKILITIAFLSTQVSFDLLGTMIISRKRAGGNRNLSSGLGFGSATAIGITRITGRIGDAVKRTIRVSAIQFVLLIDREPFSADLALELDRFAWPAGETVGEFSRYEITSPEEHSTAIAFLFRGAESF